MAVSASYSLKAKLQSIEVSGHHFLIKFELFYMGVAFALHGQVTVTDEATLNDICEGTHYLRSLT